MWNILKRLKIEAFGVDYLEGGLEKCLETQLG